MTKKEKENLIKLLNSESQDDFDLANNIIEKLSLKYEELEKLALLAELDSSYYFIATRAGKIIRVIGHWNKMDAIWKEKKLKDS